MSVKLDSGVISLAGTNHSTVDGVVENLNFARQ